MANHHNNPVPATIKTADGHTVSVGDEVHNYYDCKTGFIEKISHGDVPDDGWADLSNEAGFVNGQRISTACRTCGYGVDF
jgi:hypothetical protein